MHLKTNKCLQFNYGPLIVQVTLLKSQYAHHLQNIMMNKVSISYTDNKKNKNMKYAIRIQENTWVQGSNWY